MLVRPYVIRYRTKEYEIADSLAEIIPLKPMAVLLPSMIKK
ncbi:MAG: hypothetical protein R3C26_26660 [Calditrichia bacterium]